jgi:RES domain-containing protein
VRLRSWRIVRSRFAATALTGLGARAYGGRWNSVGTTVIYTAGSMALATLELLVHVQSEDVLARYVCFEVTFEEELVKVLSPGLLPARWWQARPSAALRRLGDDWAASLDRPILRVPSAVVRAEWNYLLNPLHPEFTRIKIGPRQPLRMDKRLQ